MRTIEFNGKIENNHIIIPDNFQKEINKTHPKSIRVKVFIEEDTEEFEFKQLSQTEFLKGYSESDEIYDSL